MRDLKVLLLIQLTMKKSTIYMIHYNFFSMLILLFQQMRSLYAVVTLNIALKI